MCGSFALIFAYFPDISMPPSDIETPTISTALTVLLGICLGKRIRRDSTMGTKIESKYGKTQGKVKNHPPIMEGISLLFPVFCHTWTVF